MDRYHKKIQEMDILLSKSNDRQQRRFRCPRYICLQDTFGEPFRIHEQ